MIVIYDVTYHRNIAKHLSEIEKDIKETEQTCLILKPKYEKIKKQTNEYTIVKDKHCA